MWVTGRRMLLATAVLTFVMAIGSAIWFAVLPASEREAPECTGVLTVGPVLFGFGSAFGISMLYFGFDFSVLSPPPSHTFPGLLPSRTFR